MKAVTFTPTAAKQIDKLGVAEVRRIIGKLKAYAAGGSADVTAMQGMSGAFRLRVGDWRAVFEETADEIIVTRVGHRREVYD